jgi:predicted MFS family arabinose efflux permease
MLLEIKGVGTKYAGTAIGLIHTISRVGEIISPPAGNALAEIDPRYAFTLWAGMAAGALVLFIFLKDTRKTDRLPVE